jgi:hypothetical protein
LDSERIFAAFDADPDLATLRFNIARNPESGLARKGLGLNPSVMPRAFI